MNWWLVIVVVVVAIALIAVLASLPDIMRYFRMRKM